MRILSGLTFFLLGACAARAPAAHTSVSQAVPRSAPPVSPEAPSPAGESPAVADSQLAANAQPAVLGVIEREGMVAIIDAGLGRLFQRLKVSPALEKGRFVGFQITSMPSSWSASSLQAGDVITALNDMPVERPEQAMVAFESLRQAERLVVTLLREGVPVTLRFRIE